MKRKIFLPMFFTLVLFSGFLPTAQSQIPVVSVRFINPQFDCNNRTYCLDVEFQSNIADQQVFGMNVRFFYDDNVLEFLSLGDFQEGYASPDPPQILTGPPGSGNEFGITGPLEWFNGTVSLVDPSSIYLSTTGWTKLFNVCFHIDDPNSWNIQNFCPSIIWDLRVNPADGGYLPGDNGVVITVVDPTFEQDSAPTTENVVQFNWQYDTSGALFGFPVSIICIPTPGCPIPLSNWSLFLAIGLMLVASVFIYRRRISG